MTAAHRTTEYRKLRSTMTQNRWDSFTSEQRAKQVAAMLLAIRENNPWIGRKHSEASKKKMSLANAGMRGKHHSEETKIKQRNALLGRKHSEERKAKMRRPLTESHKAALKLAWQRRKSRIANNPS
jgi:hypothetical protein